MAEQSGTLTIVAFGDSVTEGYAFIAGIVADRLLRYVL